MAGRIYDKETLFLTVSVGTAAFYEDRYELMASATNGAPIIRSERAGKHWSIGWMELLGLALLAGIDNPEGEVQP